MRVRKFYPSFRLGVALVILATAFSYLPEQPTRAASESAMLVLGQADFTHNSAGGGGTGSGMSNPIDVAVDPGTDKVFVSDTSNHRVLRFASFASLSNGQAAEAVLGQSSFVTQGANRGGLPAANTLNYPRGLAVDAAGRLWVVDTFNHRVLRFDSAASKANGAAADGVLGQPDFTSTSANRGGAAAAQDSLNTPRGAAVDTAGRLWVADSSNHRLLRFDNAATKANGANADGVLGQANFTSASINRGSGVNINTLDSPFNLTVGSGGRLWVADTNNNRVLRFNNAASKADGADADGLLGQANFTSSSANRGGSAGVNTMYLPYDVALEGSGRLWVADNLNHRLLFFEAAGTKPDGGSSDGLFGQLNFAGASSNRGGSVAANTLSGPAAVSIDSTGRLWVADQSNHRVLGNAAIPPFQMRKTAQDVNGGFLYPLDQLQYTITLTNTLGVTQTNLFISDAFPPNTSLVAGSTSASKGTVSGSNPVNFTIGGLALNEVVTATFRVHLNPAAGGLILANGARATSSEAASQDSPAVFHHVDLPALLELGQANFTSGVANRGGSLAANTLNNPRGVAVDPTTGKVFVVDRSNHRVLRFASFNALNNGAAAEGVLGQADFTSALANRGGSVAANTLNSPYDVELDSSGRLWVSDESNHRVLRFDNAASKPDGANADGVLGQPNFTSGAANQGNLAPVQASFYFPNGLAVDAAGRLWVADLFNHRVLRFDNAASLANGSVASAVLGQTTFSAGSANGGGASALANTLYSPSGLAADASGRLWVADQDNHRLLRFDNAASKANGAAADGVLGQPDFTSGDDNRGGDPAANTLFDPQDVAVNPAGRLWVADSANNRILIFENAASKSNGANADALAGQEDFTSNSNNRGSGVAANTFYSPRCVAVDLSGQLWVSDVVNHRILVLGIRNLFMPAVLKN